MSYPLKSARSLPDFTEKAGKRSCKESNDVIMTYKKLCIKKITGVYDARNARKVVETLSYNYTGC